MRKIVFSLLFTLISAVSIAQHQCGFDEAYAQLLQSDPSYQTRVNEANAYWANLINSGNTNFVQISGTDTVFEIPVVVHIMHTGNVIGGLYNPSDADVMDMIDTLSAMFAAQVGQFPNTSNGGVDMKYRFVLAKRGPNCTPTNGINRVNASFLSGYVSDGLRRYGSVGPSELTLKNLSRWDPEKYYNIWVINKIDGYDGFSGGGVAGFAYLAYANSPDLDGTVLVSKFCNGDPDDAAVIGHELGHALGLLHTFQGDNSGSSCPTETNCATENDYVCDTEPHIRSFACPTGTNSCTGVAYNNVSYNHMNYTSCVNRFTPGQQVRAMAMGRAYRNNLLHSATGEDYPAISMTAASCTNGIVNSGNNLDIGPSSVVLQQINWESEGYSGDGDLSYIDNSCHSQTFLQNGGTYTLKVGTDGYAQKVKAYIDFNNDGVFTTSEEVLSSLTSPSGVITHTGTFTIPAGAVTCTALRMRVIADRKTSPTPGPCSTLDYGQAEDYAVIIEGTGDTVGINLVNGTNPSCPGTVLDFAAVTNATSGITYTWFLNGTAVGTGTTFTTSAANNGDVLTLRGVEASACSAGGFDTLIATYTILRQTNTNIQANLILTAGNDTVCTGDQVSIQAVLQNGNVPTYQWMVNAAPTGTGTNTLTYTPANGDIVYCAITDNNACFNGTVNTDSMSFVVVNQLAPSSTIATTAAFPVCDGVPITFSANVNNQGTAPIYDWLVNGSTVASGALTYSSSILNDGDVVRFKLTSSLTCASPVSVQSAPITVQIDPLLPISTTISFVQGANVICAGESLILEAAIANGGSSPSFDWYINGVYYASGTSIAVPAPSNGDVISVTASSSEACTSGNPASASQTITVKPTPNPIQISLVNGVLKAYPSAPSYQWYGPNGKINGATSASYTPTANGVYFCIPKDGPCIGDTSNMLDIYVLGNDILEIEQIKVYPNPTSGSFNIQLDEQISSVLMTNGLGQVLKTPFERSGNTEYSVDVRALSAGVYLIRVYTTSGKMKTARIKVD